MKMLEMIQLLKKLREKKQKTPEPPKKINFSDSDIVHLYKFYNWDL